MFILKTRLIPGMASFAAQPFVDSKLVVEDHGVGMCNSAARPIFSYRRNGLHGKSPEFGVSTTEGNDITAPL
jgi:hypothetical protein